MKKTLNISLILAIGLLVAASGCTLFEMRETGETTVQSGPGTLQISSDPWGANVYLDGVYKGRTPITLNNIPAGTYELILSKEDFSNIKETITVTAGQTTTLKKSLSVAQPKLTLTITSAESGLKTPYCYWALRGVVSNTGEAFAKDITLTATIDPDSSDYKETKKTITFGILNPGESRDYYIYIENAPCVDSTGSVKCEYLDSDDDKKSVSKSI
jgi:hypothetical protein